MLTFEAIKNALRKIGDQASYRPLTHRVGLWKTTICGKTTKSAPESRFHSMPLALHEPTVPGR
jgi:hypothetical protein